jgi:hypothetical protein
LGKTPKGKARKENAGSEQNVEEGVGGMGGRWGGAIMKSKRREH